MQAAAQVIIAWAEALAKAQYARRKDPHDCALMYVALQKKQLLLVSFVAFIIQFLTIIQTSHCESSRDVSEST